MPMDPEKLQFYKKKLLAAKAQVLNSGMAKSKEDLTIPTDDLADETDLATNVIGQEVSFTLRNKEVQKLKEIDAALMRIQMGTYGYCEECDEPIGEARLNNRPWTPLCIVHAEEKEREEMLFMRKAV